jgi:hypothetical protein
VRHIDRVMLIITERGRFKDSGRKRKSNLIIVTFTICSDSFKYFLSPFRALFNPTFATKLDLNIPPAYGLTSPTLSVIGEQSCQPPALISQPPPSLSSAPKMLTFKDMDDLTSAPLVFVKFIIISTLMSSIITEPVDFRVLCMHRQVHSCSARCHRSRRVEFCS